MFSSSTYGSEDTYELMRLLDDNTRRLQDLLNMTDRLQDEKVAVRVQIAVLIVGLLIGGAVRGGVDEFFAISIFMAIASIWFHSAVLSLRYLFLGRIRLRRAEMELRILVPKIQRVVQIASELMEHTEMEPGQRLRLGFHLDLTEEALRRADSYLRSR